jgi:hypothetical protein
MGKQIDSLKHEDATVSGRKIVQLIQALQEVQGKIKTAEYDNNRWSLAVICPALPIMLLNIGKTVYGSPCCSTP